MSKKYLEAGEFLRIGEVLVIRDDNRVYAKREGDDLPPIGLARRAFTDVDVIEYDPMRNTDHVAIAGGMPEELPVEAFQSEPMLPEPESEDYPFYLGSCGHCGAGIKRVPFNPKFIIHKPADLPYDKSVVFEDDEQDRSVIGGWVAIACIGVTARHEEENEQ